MGLYFEKENVEPYSAEELDKLREGLEQSRRFFEHPTLPNCYFRGQDTFIAVELHRNRIQVNSQVSGDAALIRLIIDTVNPSYYLEDAMSPEGSARKYPIEQRGK